MNYLINNTAAWLSSWGKNRVFRKWKSKPIRLQQPVILTLLLIVPITVLAGPHHQRPNIIIIITDDQGLGDRGQGGNPDLGQDFSHPLLELIQDYSDNPDNAGESAIAFTPNLDTLREEAVTMTDLHVTPLCAVTRATLMTGRDAPRTNVLLPTTMRAVLDPREVTIAELLKSRGYRTGMFGKWNLGPAYPSRPQDQGFDRVRFVAGGANTSASNAWDSDCYGDTFFDENGNAVKTDESVFCGEVPFADGIEFIEDQARGNHPFFAYIATFDPHWLHRVGIPGNTYPVPENAPIQQLVGYQPTNPSLPKNGLNQVLANFFSQVHAADLGIGAIRKKLEELGIADNTILIVHGDNGSEMQVQFPINGVNPNEPEFAYYNFNGGIAGGKFENRDAGHRTFFHMYYPQGKITCEENVARGKSCFNDRLSSITDVLPTIMELAGVYVPRWLQLDGKSQVRALRGHQTNDPNRVLKIMGGTSLDIPTRYNNVSVRTEDYLLVKQGPFPPAFAIPTIEFGLFDMQNDLAQEFDLSSALPSVVNELRDAYDRWYDSWIDRYPTPVPFVAGTRRQNPLRVSADTFYQYSVPPGSWDHRGLAADNGDLGLNRPHVIRIARSGRYKITVSRWPFLGSGPGGDIRCPDASQSIGCPIDPRGEGFARLVISPNESDARTLTLSESGANFVDVSQPIPAGASKTTFSVNLKRNRHRNPVYIATTLSGVLEHTPGCDVSDPVAASDPALCPVAEGRNGYHLKIERVHRRPH